ncbi:MAG TPA: hypothetical protein VI759_04065 [Dehalococcoidia bacterium]|nr:hypothetical protein [Dehalococcoidia bacterium]
MGAGTIAGDITNDGGAGALWGLAVVIAGSAIVAGLLMSQRKPVLGLRLVAVGVVVISALWFWVLFIMIPIGVALIAFAYFRGGRAGWPRGAGTV